VNFSERYGFKAIKETIQAASMDESLRTGIWSLLKIHVWNHVRHTTGLSGGYYLSSNDEIRGLCEKLWLNYFKQSLDKLDNNWTKVLEQLRHYYFEREWFEIYDFIEFIANNYRRYQFRERFMTACNALLEEEMSAYRFVDGVITRITEQHELSQIEQALKTSTDPVNTHLHRSLKLLSDPVAPDYRSSTRESLSAVKHFAAFILDDENGSLGQLLKKLEDHTALPPALKTAFKHLYGYTVDETGIRHPMTEKENIDFNDAKFMLNVCAAFINFVEGKVHNKE